MEENNDDLKIIERIIKKIPKEEGYKLGKIIGKGGFGLVVEIKIKDKIFAGKLIKKKRGGSIDEADLIMNFRGPGIVKINKVIKDEDGNNIYHLIIMEKAALKSLGSFNYHLHFKNIFNLIFESPFEIVGDNLIRFYARQIIKGLEILNRSNYSHFDLKPGNILTFISMNLKLTDFGLLRNPETLKDEDDKFYIPGGTRGYLTPEYYSCDRKIKIEDAKKQDYFSLGATLYELKYGEGMLNYIDYNDKIITSDLIIDLIQKTMDEIKSKKLSDKGFIDFLCSLIQYVPEERPDFEKIYRNKWLHKNSEELINIKENNQLDEKKMVLEIDKSDYLIDKKKYLDNKRNKDNRKIRRHKFIFKDEGKIY